MEISCEWYWCSCFQRHALEHDAFDPQNVLRELGQALEYDVDKRKAAHHCCCALVVELFASEHDGNVRNRLFVVTR
jgi:hypothetical protein